jgi:hypothetical protein
MTVSLPFLTLADPPGTSEGSLDPLGLYAIADALATQLVPAVRERMIRVRFLTAMAVGATITDGLEYDSRYRESLPYLVWEWHVVEAMVRRRDTGDDRKVTNGVAGIGVTRRAVRQHDCLDARTYLATPRVFGFNGVYKRLAIHLGITDVHLAPGPNAARLIDAWSRDRTRAGLSDWRALLPRWRAAVERALDQSPATTRPGWNRDAWDQLAHAFLPGTAGPEERRLLRDCLTTRGDGRLGALPDIWELVEGLRDDDLPETHLHDKLEKRDPSLGPLLAAIRAYEVFSRRLQDAFDVLRFAAAHDDGRGFHVPEIARKPEFQAAMDGLHALFARAAASLAEVPPKPIALQPLFTRRFNVFAEHLAVEDAAKTLVSLHGTVQKEKSAAGKRPWFDDMGAGRIHVRHAYRLEEFEPKPARYLHAYRGQPIGRFRNDLVRR